MPITIVSEEKCRQQLSGEEFSQRRLKSIQAWKLKSDVIGRPEAWHLPVAGTKKTFPRPSIQVRISGSGKAKKNSVIKY